MTLTDYADLYLFDSHQFTISVTRDDVLTALALVILLYSAMVTWTVYSFGILLAVVVIAVAWYFRK